MPGLGAEFWVARNLCILKFILCVFLLCRSLQGLSTALSHLGVRAGFMYKHLGKSFVSENCSSHLRNGNITSCSTYLSVLEKSKTGCLHALVQNIVIILVSAWFRSISLYNNSLLLA